MADDLLTDHDIVRGAERTPANRSLDAAGSIHDDDTATRHGFRGGTVAGNVHLDHFPPLLLDLFSPTWFETGLVSMWFKQPTTHLEPVVTAAQRPDGNGCAPLWLLTPDGSVVAEGDAATGDVDPGGTTLRRRDRRACDPAETTLLRDLPVGERIDAGTVEVDLDRQHHLLTRPELLVEPLDWYRNESPWGPPVACPSVAVDTLWEAFERRLRGQVGAAVGLYGAIELRHHRGPLLAGRTYALSGSIETVSRSPRTELFWAGTEARDESGGVVASLLMVIRLLIAPPV